MTILLTDGHDGDVGTGVGRQFGDVVADPAGCAGQQDAPPGDAARAAEQAQGGKARQRQGGRRDGRHAIRQRGQGRGRDRGVFGPPACFGMPDHPLPLGRPGSVGGRLHHQSGDVLAGPRPRAGLFQLEDLTAVDRERLHLDQGLAGLGLGQAVSAKATSASGRPAGTSAFMTASKPALTPGGPTALGLG
jgi:hypothetical protein